MRGLSFVAGGALYLVDVTLVQKVVRNMMATPVPTAPEAVVGIASLKGKIVTVLSLPVLLGRAAQKASAPISAIIIKPFGDSGDHVGLLIDKPGDLIAIDEILPPPVTAGTDETRCISGVTEAEGTLYRIVDIHAIIDRFMREGTNQ